MSNFDHSTTSISELSLAAVRDDTLFVDDVGCVPQDTRQHGLSTSFPQTVEGRKDSAYVDDDNEEDHEEGSAEGHEENNEEGADKDSESSESDSGDVSVMAWVPPEILPVDMEYTIWKLLPWEEHDIYDDLVVHLFETYKGPWPSPEDVFNDVQLASTILCLILVTASPDIPLQPEWTVTANVAVLAEQEILRQNLASAVFGKSFERLRSLGFWYEGY